MVPETDNTTQTDAFLERPQTPPCVPAKSGEDAATQIEDGEHISSTAAKTLRPMPESGPSWAVSWQPSLLRFFCRCWLLALCTSAAPRADPAS